MSKEKHLYDFDDYKEYLNYRCDKERGLKSALAKVMQCQSAYISQVLNDHSHLSLEQADLAASYFKLSDKETLFLLLLIQKDRAGTSSLKSFFTKQLADFRSVQLSYLKRRDLKSHLDVKAQAIYYSSWEYNALHMAVTIPRLRTKEALLKAFVLPESRFNHCMEFLLENGLVKRTGDHYVTGTVEMYLESGSNFLRQLHLNTRAQAIASLDRERPENAHYSAVFTMSEKDVIKIKKMINDSLSEIATVVKVSKEEQICGFSINFFNYEKTV